jgi:hypothetical protein
MMGSAKAALTVDICTMLPIAYDDAQSYEPPRLSYVLKKGDAAWASVRASA